MADIQTHAYKTLPSGQQILLDIYTPSELSERSVPDTDPILLFFHAGGLTSFNRKTLSPHLVQSVLRRGWTLVSADYRLLPQASGADLWDDVKDAYEFVLMRLPNILHNSSASWGPQMARKARRIIIGGASAGAYLAFLATSRFEELSPPPVATLGYYPAPSFKHPFFNSSHVFGAQPLKREELVGMLDDERVLTGTDYGVAPFDVECLNEDLSRNATFTAQEPEVHEGLDRPDIYDWLVQENEYPKIFGDLEGTFDAEKEKFPKVVILHSEGDVDVPFQLSKDFVEGVGKDKARLVVVEGNDHVFDEGLFLEDGGEKVKKVEEAWRLLDMVVKSGGFEH